MLKEILEKYNLNEEQLIKLNNLRDIVLEHNKHTNLTSITNVKEFNIKHILDSISIIDFFDLRNKNILDVGVGGGFPGLVLAIVLPSSNITMLDSNNKKIQFVKEAGEKLKLNNISTIYSRVEEAKIDEKYDCVVSRAVASLNVLLEITSSALQVQGTLIFYKGSNLNDELPKNWNIVQNELGLEFDNIQSFNLTKDIERSFISFKKINKTKQKYPRLYSTIKHTPLY